MIDIQKFQFCNEFNNLHISLKCEVLGSQKLYSVNHLQTFKNFIYKIIENAGNSIIITYMISPGVFMNSGISFENQNGELTIVKNGETVLTAESLYSIVFDLLTVNCFLPEEWPPIRQKFDKNKKIYEISIGAESEKQMIKEIIADAAYIEELREGEYFLESVIDPPKFISILKKKLIYLGLAEVNDFRIDYNRRFGRITVVFTGYN